MSSSFVDYYAVLGLDRCACEVEDESTPQEVDSKVCRSYRSKALTCHPDHAKGSIADVSLFHRVSDAYANLKDVNVRQNFKNNSPSAVKKPSTDICIMYESNSEAEMLNHLTDNRRLFLETTLYEYFRNNRFDPFKKTAQEAFSNLLELSLYIEEAGGSIPIEGDGGDQSFEDFTESHPNFPCADGIEQFCNRYRSWGLVYNRSTVDNTSGTIRFNADFSRSNVESTNKPSWFAWFSPFASSRSFMTKNPTGFNWNVKKGHRKVIVIGGTGHGKSTFINSVHNFFMGNGIDDLEALIPTKHLSAIRCAPRHSEAAVADVTKSQTMECTSYVFRSPSDPGNTSITLIDTPGLADTRGASQDDENILKILKTAAATEESGELTGVVLVMKGNENRRTVSVDTVMTILQGSLPDAILANMLVVFTSCQFETYCQAGRLITAEIPPHSRFYVDAAAFLEPVSELNFQVREDVSKKWDGTMSTLNLVMTALMTQSGVVASGLSTLMKQRMSFKASFHEIKHNFASLQTTLEEMETVARVKADAETEVVANANYRRKTTRVVKELVDDPSGRHSTICSSCNHVCHAACGLDEICDKGSNGFRNCAAFQHQPKCRVCSGRCSFTAHYHGRKTIVEMEKTLEEDIADMKAKYEEATQSLDLATKKGLEVGDVKRLVDEAIKDNIKNLSRQCVGIKKLCRGFNLVDELALVVSQLEAEQKKIRNLQARASAGKVIAALVAMIDGVEADTLCITDGVDALKLSKSKRPADNEHNSSNDQARGKRVSTRVKAPKALY